MRMKIYFHTGGKSIFMQEENPFSCRRKSIFIRRKIHFQAEEPQRGFTAKLFFPIFVEDTMR